MRKRKPIKRCDSPHVLFGGTFGKYHVDKCWNCNKVIDKYDPEIGQAVFGCPTGEYDFNSLTDAHVIEYMLRIIAYFATGDVTYASHPIEDEFKNDVFEIRPYYWGDDDEEAELPNFKHYESGLEIRRYKYIGRGMSVNKPTCPRCFANIFADCLNSLAEKEG